MKNPAFVLFQLLLVAIGQITVGVYPSSISASDPNAGVIGVRPL